MRIDYSRPIRIWHWLNALAVTGLLGTFFLRKTFLSWRDNAALITEKLSSFGIDVTAEQAKAVAKAIRAPMWEWHIIFGVMLALLLLFRIWIFWEEAGFGYDDEESLHMRMVHWGYRLFYLILIFMAVSGLVLTWHEALGITKDFTHSIKEVHEFVAWAVVFFVPLHIAGVVIADNSDQKGITSRMISG
ncbi:MAG: cytochrome b/b6 domain-containing protein [Campylobacterota bacterium]|nr:cytochrome b/b6 domain-containing protein [Campylobacterota bacterium]